MAPEESSLLKRVFSNSNKRNESNKIYFDSFSIKPDKKYFRARLHYGLLDLEENDLFKMNQIKYKIIDHWKNNFLINALVFESEN